MPGHGGWRCFGIGLEGWADDQTYGGAHSAELHRKAAAAVLLLAGVAAGGPALIAVVAFVGRMTRAGAVYVALAIALGAFALPAAAAACTRLIQSPDRRAGALARPD